MLLLDVHPGCWLRWLRQGQLHGAVQEHRGLREDPECVNARERGVGVHAFSIIPLSYSHNENVETSSFFWLLTYCF